MTRFIYDGPGNRLILAGQTLVQGQVVELEGHAAEAAARHPGVSKAGDDKAARAAHSAPNKSDGLAARRALVARAKELDIPATGKSDALTAAIAEAEQAAADSGGGAE